MTCEFVETNSKEHVIEKKWMGRKSSAIFRVHHPILRYIKQKKRVLPCKCKKVKHAKICATVVDVHVGEFIEDH